MPSGMASVKASGVKFTNQNLVYLIPNLIPALPSERTVNSGNANIDLFERS